MGGNPGHASDLKAVHLVRQPTVGAQEGHMIAAADARAMQSYGHDGSDGGGVGVEGMEDDLDGTVEGDARHDHGGLGDPLFVIVPPADSNQLTLSFHGEVYMFDSISPEKVQAVLLLQAGRT